MKRRIFIVIGCVLIAFQAMAQSENRAKVLSKEKKQTTINTEFIDIPIQSIGIDEQLIVPDYKEQKSSLEAKVAEKPAIRLTPPHYDNSGIFPLYKRMFIYLKGEQKQYMNLASYNLAYMALGFRLNSKLNLTGGLLAVKQFTNYVPYGIDRSGVRFNLNYAITNQLDLNVWGQYLTGSPIYSPVDNLLPQTGTGASMVLNLGDGSQFGVGAEYQYDDKQEKWNYQSGGKLKLNF